MLHISAKSNQHVKQLSFANTVKCNKQVKSGHLPFDQNITTIANKKCSLSIIPSLDLTV